MAIPQNKVELLSAIDKEYAKLSHEIARIPPTLVAEQSMPGHAKDSMISPHQGASQNPAVAKMA